MDGKGEVSYKSLCNACLCVGQGLNLITDVKLKRFYLDALNEIPVCNIADITPVLCWDCEALLQRSMLFREQVKDSYQVLLTYTSENIRNILLTGVFRTPRLQIKTNDTIVILPDDVTSVEEVDRLTIKNELQADWENDRLTIKNELQADLENARGKKVIPDVPEKKSDEVNLKVEYDKGIIPETTEFLEIRPDHQPAYVEDVLKVEHNRDGDSDNNADEIYQPISEKNIHTKRRKKCKKTVSEKRIKSIKKDKVKKVKSKKGTKNQELQILTIELSYEDMMLERDKEMSKDSYLNSEYKCESCILGFNYYKSYSSHLAMKHSENIGEYSCPVCKTNHTSVDSFTAHYKRHMRRYECGICQKRTMDLKVMQQHYYSTHDITLKEYKCDDCGKISNSVDTHRYHRESHRARLQCSECDKTFRHRAGLLNHRLAVHEFKNKFPCNICNKVFKWRTSLRRHQETHEKKKPVAAAAYCALCGVSFSSLCSYQRHMTNSLKHITKDQLRFICDHCNVKFADKTKLRDHIEEKHLHKTFQCNICLKTSKNRVGLDQHIRNVHKGRPNNKMCHHCGKGFPTKVQLESHIRTHTGERPFICEYCPTTFSQQSNLYKHNRQVHLNVKSKRYPTCKKSDNAPLPEPSMNPGPLPILYSETGYLTAEL